jgi:hypothetical protein
VFLGAEKHATDFNFIFRGGRGEAAPAKGAGAIRKTGGQRLAFLYWLWALVRYCMMRVMRFVFALIWPPSPDLLHPDAVQAFFSFVNAS